MPYQLTTNHVDAEGRPYDAGSILPEDYPEDDAESLVATGGAIKVSKAEARRIEKEAEEG